MTAKEEIIKELIELFDSKGETRTLPIFNYVDEHYPVFNYPYENVGEEIFKALKELDRLRVFKQTFDNYELAKKQDFIAYENWQECETEHSQLVQDVKRYFELQNMWNWKQRKEWTDELDAEYKALRIKLEKVGNE